MVEEHELEDVSREEAAAVLYRLADDVAVGSVKIGEETIAVPEQLEVEIEHEVDEDERELEVELEWPLSAEPAGEVVPREGSDLEGKAPGTAAGADTDADAAAVADAPVEAPTEEELTGDDTGEGESERQEPDAATTPTSVVEPGETVEPADVLEPAETVESGSRARFELFEDAAGEWRWRLVHDNGNVIADSGEGYSRKANAKKGLRSVRTNAPGADIVDE